MQLAIEKLQYRPNELARTFRGHGGRTIIRLILPTLYDSFFANCAQAVTTVAREQGYSLIMTTSNGDPDTEFEEAEQMLQWNVDGVVAIPSNPATRGSRALFCKTPVVIFDCPVEDPAFDTVLVQNTPTARGMIEHLIGHGHQRICFMGFTRNLFTINARFLGYRRAMRDAGLKRMLSLDVESQDDTMRTVEAKLHGPEPPTGHLLVQYADHASRPGGADQLGCEDARRSGLCLLR